ncbi:hypothetical protein ACFE04_007724 [Oxalis oulophora]
MEPATSATTAAGATITLTIHLMFTTDNPNAVGIKYGESKFTVMYRGMPLGKAVVPRLVNYSTAEFIQLSLKAEGFFNMVQTLELIKGGGGSIRVGSTGTIGALMTKEMDSIKSSGKTEISARDKPQTIPVSIPCSAPKKLQSRKSLDEASSSGTSKENDTEIRRKSRSFNKSTHRVPMLRSDNMSLERTPSRVKSEKKNIVEIVDIKCGNPDKAWAGPITTRLKKLGFSKLSESMI